MVLLLQLRLGLLFPGLPRRFTLGMVLLRARGRALPSKRWCTSATGRRVPGLGPQPKSCHATMAAVQQARSTATSRGGGSAGRPAPSMSTMATSRRRHTFTRIRRGRDLDFVARLCSLLLSSITCSITPITVMFHLSDSLASSWGKEGGCIAMASQDVRHGCGHRYIIPSSSS